MPATEAEQNAIGRQHPQRLRTMEIDCMPVVMTCSIANAALRLIDLPKGSVGEARWRRVPDFFLRALPIDAGSVGHSVAWMKSPSSFLGSHARKHGGMRCKLVAR